MNAELLIDRQLKIKWINLGSGGTRWLLIDSACFDFINLFDFQKILKVQSSLFNADRLGL